MHIYIEIQINIQIAGIGDTCAQFHLLIFGANEMFNSINTDRYSGDSFVNVFFFIIIIIFFIFFLYISKVHGEKHFRK